MLGRILICAAAGAAAVGCAEPTSSVGRSRASIVGGGGSGPEDDAVVHLVVRLPTQQIARCSSTLIAPNLVLTARHCVSVYTSDGSFTCTTSGDLVDYGSGAGVMSVLRPADSVEAYLGEVPDILSEPVARGVEIFALDTVTICRNDIALVLLDRDLDVAPMAMRLDAPTVPGETIRVVGFGQSELGIGIRRSRDEVRIVAVGQSEFWPDGGAAPPRDFAVGEGPCSGDSGGPALTVNNAVTGVSSFSTPADCQADNVRNYFTQVAPFADLVMEALDAAGSEPWIEGQPPPSRVSGGAGGMAQGGAGDGGGAPATGGSSQVAGASGAPVQSGEGGAGGCGCATVGAARGMPWWVALWGGIAVFWRRRGKSKRCPAG